MLYLLAIICPPLAVLLAGKPGSALLNLVLTICLWIPGVIHAFLVINSAQADKRTERIVKELKKQQDK